MQVVPLPVFYFLLVCNHAFSKSTQLEVSATIFFFSQIQQQLNCVANDTVTESIDPHGGEGWATCLPYKNYSS